MHENFKTFTSFDGQIITSWELSSADLSRNDRAINDTAASDVGTIVPMTSESSLSRVSCRSALSNDFLRVRQTGTSKTTASAVAFFRVHVS